MRFPQLFIKVLCIFMMMLYLLNMSGARSSIVSSLIIPFLPYKCSGHGCACDLAGRELPGCACFGIDDTDATSDSDSCGPSEEQSCCSSKKEEPDSDSEQEKNNLDKVGCGGAINGLYEMLDRHLNFDIKIHTFYKEIAYHQSPAKLLAKSKPNLIRLGKVPIA